MSRSALSNILESALEDLTEEQSAHHHYDGKDWYVDTGFVQASAKAIPGFTLSHVGGGEFTLKGPDGEIDFDRSRGKNFDGQVGRSHKLFDNKGGALIKKLIAAMKSQSQGTQSESLDEATNGEAAKWAKSVAADLTKMIRPKPKSVKVTKAEMSMPRGWDHRFNTTLTVVLSSGEVIPADLVLNCASEQCSGMAILPDKHGGTVAQSRKASPEEVTEMLVSELSTHLSRRGQDESLDEAQRVAPGYSFDGEEEPSKPGAFKVSSKALSLMKDAFGDSWKGPESAIFKRQKDLLLGLSQQDLMDLFGADRIDVAQDIIAGKPKAAFNKFLAMSARVNPALGKLVRSQPENAALYFYMVVVRISGRDMADIVLKRYFETESSHIGAFKSKMNTEELARILD